MNRHGFSYIEILIALAIFAVALVALLPTLSQAGRNLAFAQNTYAANLHARHMMLVVRDAMQTTTPDALVAAPPTTQELAAAEAAARAFAYDRGDFPFSLRLVRGTQIIHFVPSRDNGEPPLPDTFDFTALPNRTAIIVAIYNEHGQAIARAAGVR